MPVVLGLDGERERENERERTRERKIKRKGVCVCVCEGFYKRSTLVCGSSRNCTAAGGGHIEPPPPKATSSTYPLQGLCAGSRAAPFIHILHYDFPTHGVFHSDAQKPHMQPWAACISGHRHSPKAPIAFQQGLCAEASTTVLSLVSYYNPLTLGSLQW